MPRFLLFTFFILALVISANLSAQTVTLTGSITNRDTTAGNAYWYVFLKQKDTTIKRTMNDDKGNFTLTGIPIGNYLLQFESIAFRTILRENLQILNDTTIIIKYPEPCEFKYTLYLKHGKPVCPIGNHTDSIITIVYGLPNSKTLEKAKKGLLRLAGCELTGCNPHYYCTIHKKEL